MDVKHILEVKYSMEGETYTRGKILYGCETYSRGKI